VKDPILPDKNDNEESDLEQSIQEEGEESEAEDDDEGEGESEKGSGSEDYLMPSRIKKKKIKYFDGLAEEIQMTNRTILIHHMDQENFEFVLKKIYTLELCHPRMIIIGTKDVTILRGSYYMRKLSEAGVLIAVTKLTDKEKMFKSSKNDYFLKKVTPVYDTVPVSWGEGNLG
jgi:hypothetical protein